MANQVSGNPIVMDTAATLSGRTTIRQIQWVDDAADIADDDDLVLKMNGVTITGKVALTANELGTLVLYQAGPFNPGIDVEDFQVVTIDHGSLVVWLG